MYSYEDRIRAVLLYIQLGKRTGVTIRQLGYPTKNALKSWYHAYLQGNDLPAGYVRAKPKYSDEQKSVAVAHYFQHGCCIATTLRALGYPGRKTLSAWLDELHPEMRKRIVGKARADGHPQELKQAAVIALCSRQGSARAIAQELGVTRPTLYNWKDQLLEHGAPASMKRHRDSSPAAEQAELAQQRDALQRDILQLQLEHDILKKAVELIKKDLGVDLHLLSNREKTVLVDALRARYGLSALFTKLGLARSSYFYHRARRQMADKYADVRGLMADIFERNHRCYGYQRIRASLSRQQFFLSEKVVLRLMKQEQLVAAKPKRRRYGSYLGEISPAPENLINRDFQAAALDKALTHSQLLRVFRILLGEHVSLKDVVPIASTLLENADATKDPILLAAEVRCTLRRQIVNSLIGPQQEMRAFNLGAEVENMLLGALSQAQQSGKVALDNFAVEPNILAQLQQNMPAIREQMKQQAAAPLLLVMPQIRPLLARYARLFAPGLAVLSYNEIPENREVSIIGTLG